MTTQPDVFVLVGDCVGVEPFNRELEAGRLPTLRSLARTGVEFTRAVSTSTWSLPAHGSLFTGKYPWANDVLHPIDRLDESHPTLGEVANLSGYATAGFSSNPYVSYETGLARGLKDFRCGHFVDLALRRPVKAPTTEHQSLYPKRAPGRLWDALCKNSVPLRNSIRRVVCEIPALLDLPVRVGAKLKNGLVARSLVVSPWIEAAFEAWLTNVPPSNPAFCFVNFMDAHEPYIGGFDWLGLSTELRGVWRAHKWTMGYSSPYKTVRDPKVLETLNELYRESIRLVDFRVRSILESIARLRDWENCVIVFLGDHGQLFGGYGTYCHGIGTSDSLLRVPLILRCPETHGESLSWTDWVSLKDLGNVLARVMRGDGSRGIADLFRDCYDPSEGVWAVTEVPRESERNGRVVSEWRLVGYRDDTKQVIDPVRDGLAGCPLTGIDMPPKGSAESFSASPCSQGVSGSLRAAWIETILADRFQMNVDRRLHAWGY